MRIPALATLFFFAIACYGQKQLLLQSPAKNIQFSLQSSKGVASYSISYQQKKVILASNLGLSFQGGAVFGQNVMLGKPVLTKGESKYELQAGRSRMVDEQYNEMMIPLTDKKTRVNLRVRAFNDAVAFRYEFPASGTDSVFVLDEESTQFRFNGDPKILALLLPNFTSSHEGEYIDTALAAIQDDTLIEMPTVFHLPGNVYAAITEARLVDYAGMYLVKKKGVLTSQLSPLPNQNGIKVRAKLPHESPWRVIMLSDRPGAFIESNVLTNLNEDPAAGPMTWLKPGLTTFPWWNGNVTPDTLNAPGNNFVTNQYYIDFCARNNITYHSVVEYGLHQWYTDDGVGFQPGPNADVTKPVPGLDMKEICDYAKSKGVGVRVWVHWAALYPKLDSAFAIFERWGLSGMMIDFMDRDDQEMVNMQEEMLAKAAKHRLHIQFHGAYKPTGRSRTWPNEFTREGTLNYEVNKWGKRITPDHDLNIIYTRMIAGSTDYHLGGFRAVPDSLFKVQYTRPLMMGTRCHMLAMYVVMENTLGMVCDYPAAYEGQPGFDFIKAVPTTWDETHFISGNWHEYIAVMRKKGDDFYIGAINNHEAREITLKLDFLPAGEYSLLQYSDADDVRTNPNHLVKKTLRVKAGDVIKIKLGAGGGVAIHLSGAN